MKQDCVFVVVGKPSRCIVNSIRPDYADYVRLAGV